MVGQVAALKIMFNLVINIREGSNWRWSGENHSTRSVPRQGEMLWLESNKNWFRVDVVVHPLKDDSVDAILYVVDSGLNSEVFQQLEFESIH